MVKDDPHQVYCQRYYLLNVFEIHDLGLLNNHLVLVFDVDKPNFKFGIAMAVGQLAKEYNLVLAHGILRGVDVLNDIYDARHSRDAVENHPVTYNFRHQNRRNLLHYSPMPSKNISSATFVELLFILRVSTVF